MEAQQPVVAGSRFGPYEILSSLGAGGMGEVYRARDDRLDRIVALKILPPDRSGDPELRERLRREARALSRLSHPNVCAVFDVGTEGGRDYFVMELLTGETLAGRLQRGPLSLEQTLDVGVQIAGALESAHRAGVVHRDLKPANVMLTPSGLKLLDFGIARFASAESTTMRDTMTATLADGGAVAGTLPYMSPEQLEGREADARSDIFSFGALLYEVITGRRAFGGESPARVTASILTDDPPPVLSLQSSAPRELDRLIRSCLAKDPAERWQSAHDLRLELGWLADRIREPASDTGRRSGYRPLWIAAGVLGGLAAGFLIAALLTRRPPDRPAVRAMILPPQDTQFTPVGTQGGPAVLSPDGRRLAFAASGPDGRPRLWVQSLGSLVAQALTGTDNGAFPFWAPDGGQLGFFADTKLKKIDIASGTVSTLSDARGAGGTWNRDGTIVFARGGNTGLYRVSGDGGSPTPVTTLDGQRRHYSHGWPAFLPDGRRFLYAAQSGSGGAWTIRVGSLDSNHIEDVMEAHSNALYANGSLIFVRDGTLLAQRVDERTLRASGEPVPLAENILHDVSLGRAVFSASEHGTLVYQTGSGVLPSRLVWLDRTGNNVGVVDDACACTWPSLSPDERKAAVSLTDPRTGSTDIHIYHLGDGQQQQLTFEETPQIYPAWTPDGSRVVFTSRRTGFGDIHWKDALGAGPQEVLLESDREKAVMDVTAERIVFSQGGDFWLLPLARGAKPQEFRVSERPELFGQISPDGRWFVYQSNEVSKPEVFVTSFPERKGKWPVSEDGGMLPRWSRDGREIFYLKQDHSTMFAVALGEEGGSFRVLKRERLFTVPMLLGRGWPYDVSRDGRFLAIASSGTTTAPLTLVVDWPSEVRR